MLLRRHHITSFLQALLVCFAFTSCARDYFSDDFVSKDESNSTFYYLTIQLQLNDNSLSTRATNTNGDDLEYGEHDEHMIGKDNNIIILFRKDKNNVEKLFGVFDLTSLTGHEHNTEDGRPNEETQDPGTNKDNNVNENIEAIHRYSTEFRADGEAFLPTSCLVVLNPSEKIREQLLEFKKEDKKNNATVNDILDEIWEETGVEDNPRNIGFADTEHKYFTMTNSIYFDNNNKKQAEVAIPEGFIAKSLMAAKPVTIRVERMVAKFSLKTQNQNRTYVPKKEDSDKVDPLIFFNGIEQNGTISYRDVLWQIKVTGWGINALETKNRIFKNIIKNDYFDGVNNSANFRAHWSEDPHYDMDNSGNVWHYPWQYRWAVDKNLNYYKALDGSANSGNNNNLLRNFSYNYIYNETNPKINGSPTDEFGRIVYTPENTYDPSQYTIEQDGYLDSRTNLLAGTHLIVCAELQTELDEKEDYQPNNVYRDRTGIFFESEKECFVAFAYAFNQTIQSQGSMKVTCYNWEEGGIKDEALYAKPKADNYWLYYNNEKLTNEYLSEIMNNWSDTEFQEWFGSMVPATIRHGDGKLLPWSEDFKWEIKDDTGNKLELYEKDSYGKDDAGHYKDIPGAFKRTVDEDDIKSLLYEWLGAIDHFSDGKMYYSAPVLHNGVITDEPSQDIMGDYGVVRNNWYKFQLNDIKSIGIPVDAPDEPIVPELIDINDVINVSVSIFDWHLVDTTAPVLGN